jgi:hypothetical protein
MDVTVQLHRLDAYDDLQAPAKVSEDGQANETDQDTQ